MADGTPRTRCVSAHTDGNLCDECAERVRNTIPRLNPSFGSSLSLEEAEALYQSVRDLDEDCAGQLVPSPLAFGEWIPISCPDDDEVPLDAWREWAALGEDTQAHLDWLDDCETLGLDDNKEDCRG